MTYIAIIVLVLLVGCAKVPEQVLLLKHIPVACPYVVPKTYCEKPYRSHVELTGAEWTKCYYAVEKLKDAIADCQERTSRNHPSLGAP